MSLMRTRWAAVGAAVAVTLGGGGIAMVSATTPADAVTYIPITPCRVMDTRPGDDNVGPKASPLGPGETHVVATTGAAGDCTEVPTDASAVAMNMTAVGATELTFLTVWDGSDPRPVSSSLNPAPGQPPTPNALTTNLDADGEFSIYNLTGNVDVLADIVGYYVDHHHDDRYYTKTESDERYTTQSDNDARYYTRREVVDRTAFATTDERTYSGPQSELSDTLTPVTWTDVTAPVDGVLTINASANVFHGTAGDDVVCAIMRAGDTPPPLGTNFVGVLWFESEGPNSNDATISGTRQYPIGAGDTRTFELRCAESGADGGRVFAAVITAVFTPTL